MNSTFSITQPNNRGFINGIIYEKPTKQFAVEGESFYEGKLATQRLSEATDILPFTISEKLLKAYNLSLECGDQIKFIGELRSYNKLIEGKSRLILSFFVKEVENSSEMGNETTNELSLVGYICKPPVYRTTPFNRQICDVLLAVNRPNFNKSDYIPCILWGRNAKFIQNQEVGTKVSVLGRIQSRNYRKEIKEGEFEERTAYEVSCQSISILENQKSQDDIDKDLA